MPLLPTTTLPGDFNVDGVVDAADYTVWRNSLGSTTLSAADADLNGVVDAADYEVWRANFGDFRPALNAAANVPEPAAIRMLLVAAAGLSIQRLCLGDSQCFRSHRSVAKGRNIPQGRNRDC